MQQFKVDLKTFLGLAMPNQYSQTVRKQTSSWFQGDNFGPKSHTFMITIYSTTVLYDKQTLVVYKFCSLLNRAIAMCAYITTKMVY